MENVNAITNVTTPLTIPEKIPTPELTTPAAKFCTNVTIESASDDQSILSSATAGASAG